MKLFTLFGFLFCLGSSAHEIMAGELRRMTSTKNKLSYACEIQYRNKKAKLEVHLDTESRFMETYLEEGVVVKGYATETFDPGTQTTIYFIQGSSAPLAQQLSLSVREGGQWAQFKRTYGGYAFICNPK